MAVFLLAMPGAAAAKQQKQPAVVTCTTGSLPHGDKAAPPDLVVMSGSCLVDGLENGQPNQDYFFRNVNILGGGSLNFAEATINFWANNILVQYNGSLIAGSRQAPWGSKGQILTIYLYGADQGGDAMPHSGSHQKGAAGITCLTTSDQGKTFVTDKQCEVPDDIWNSNPIAAMDQPHMNPQTPCVKNKFPGNPLPGANYIPDCFYQYAPIDYDDGDPYGYFGYKVLAVSYGGTLQLFGFKGTWFLPEQSTSNNSFTGVSWVRLNADVNAGDDKIVVDRTIPAGKWAKGDQIVLTSTDYLPGHSEQLTVDYVDTDGKTVHLQGKVAWPHRGTRYDLNAKGVPANVGPQDDIYQPKGSGRFVDTRAAVGLLSRSIRIVSGGDNAGVQFPDEPDPTKTSAPGYYYGGHTIVRQGFRAFQVQGVEFKQLGQGGRIMHYPVHFHMGREVPRPNLSQLYVGTYVKDSSVWDSMNRWYTIHATQGVELSRNVGYKSIGHGYYLEDGTETENTIYANLGVLARGAVKQGAGGPPPIPEDGAQAQNPRQVPGIFAGGYPNATTDPVPYTSDVDHPTIFWITNGWNAFQYNMAVGANVCGVCYWLLPAGNSGASRWEYWESYSSEQRTFPKSDKCTDAHTGNSWACDDFSYAGSTPLARFVGNTCSTAMSSFLSISVTTACRGVVPDPAFPHLDPVENPKIPPSAWESDVYPGDDADMYYPKIDPGGSRAATACPDKGNCNPESTPLQKCAAGQLSQCKVTIIDHYTSSFNWAEQNFSAIWLRPQWYLVSNSAITDVQTGGLTMITGGDYTSSSVIPGYWGVARNNVFVGNTQDNKTSVYAMNAGPFNHYAAQSNRSLVCEGKGGNPNYCLNRNEGMTMPLNNFAVNQRLYNIYDGPSYQDSNAFLDVSKTPLEGCSPNMGAGCSDGENGQGWMYGNIQGMPKEPGKPDGSNCYMPNAAIAWKQPNGFFYPPAFHSTNLYFNGVDIRHFVIDPPFKPTDTPTGTANAYLHPFNVAASDIDAKYCARAFDMFGGFGGGSWSAIDRQTELTDDDGTLTGLNSAQVGSNKEVVSVNIEPFFRAPFEDTECASNIDTPPLTDPLTGIGTAISSPYQYVTTVVYPDCATNGKSCGTKCVDQCGTDKAVNVSRWSEDCTNQTCYGVPLWRQFQTGYEQQTKPDPFPFIMMMGAAISQRDTLTVNHGKYFIDTTVSLDSQVNALVPNSQTKKLYANFTSFTNWNNPGPFYVFLLYAKHVLDSDSTSPYKSTVQTYQMFVGAGQASNGKTEDDIAKTLTGMVQMDKSNKPFIPKPQAWPGKWSRKYDNTTGILTVTMDFSDPSLDFTATQCQPSSFCKKSGNSCGCAMPTYDPMSSPSIQAQCAAVCSQWAVKDIDCPDNGCYGFSVDLTKSTTFSDANHIPPPAPDCFPNTPDWNTGFSVASKEKGACKYPSAPKGDLNCKTAPTVRF